MQLPLLREKHFIPAIATVAVLSGLFLLVNLMRWPGWLNMGTAELILLAASFALFAGNFTAMNLRFGILVYVIGTAVFVIARSRPALMGPFSFYDGLGPFVGNVGLLLGLPWLLSVMFTYPIAVQFSENIYARALLGAVLITIPAYFFLASADQLMFLYWEETHPSIGALITWFAGGFFFHLAGHQLQVQIENRMAVPLYIVWLGFHLIVFAWKVFA